VQEALPKKVVKPFCKMGGLLYYLECHKKERSINIPETLKKTALRIHREIQDIKELLKSEELKLP